MYGNPPSIVTVSRIVNHARASAVIDLSARHIAGGVVSFNRKAPPLDLVRNASAFCNYFMDHAPRAWHDVLGHHDFDYDRRYRAALIEQGIYHFPLPCKQGSVSAAHTGEDIDRTLEATQGAVKSL